MFWLFTASATLLLVIALCVEREHAGSNVLVFTEKRWRYSEGRRPALVLKCVAALLFVGAAIVGAITVSSSYDKAQTESSHAVRTVAVLGKVRPICRTSSRAGVALG